MKVISSGNGSRKGDEADGGDECEGIGGGEFEGVAGDVYNTVDAVDDDVRDSRPPRISSSVWNSSFPYVNNGRPSDASARTGNGT